jgi:phosphonoacetaldehyde hydrolase
VQKPMGVDKKQHIREIFAMETVEKQLLAAGLSPSPSSVAPSSVAQSLSSLSRDEQISRVYDEFRMKQIRILEEETQLIPGAVDVIHALQSRDPRVSVCVTTGYDKDMLRIVVEGLRKHQINVDAGVCVSDVSVGRPSPWMCVECIHRLNDPSISFPACVKVDDTVPGILEGIHCGMWTVGVALSGNFANRSQEEWEHMDEKEMNEIREIARMKFGDCGAHYVVDGVWELDSVLVDISERLKAGETP